jgi:hypothetical protein
MLFNQLGKRSCERFTRSRRRNAANLGEDGKKKGVNYNFQGCKRLRGDVNVPLAAGVVAAKGLESGVTEAGDRFDRGSTLSVARGLHIFRYVGFQGAGAPAVARLIPPNAGVTLLDMPGRERGELQRPGDCLVVRADRGCDVVVGLRRGAPNGSLDATFRLEPIVLAEEAPVAPVIEAPSAPAPAPAALSFLAHLANRGDTAFAQEAWAGGPDSPAAIEGLQIVAEGGAAPLELQALVGSRPPRWSEWVSAGQFAGTRGHGLPLVGVRLRLKPETVGLEIAAEALFLGALVASQRGRQVEFVSGSGIDPLVGVKIGLHSVRETSASGAASVPDAQTRDREPRVRVFRASAAR